MTNDARTLPNARALALVSMCLALARDEPALTAWGAVNSDALKGLDQPTYDAARAAYARRLRELRGDLK